MSEPPTIRPLATGEDYRACVELQEQTWGSGFSERVPPAVLKVSQLLGGVAAGAFDRGERMVGFVFGMTGPRGGQVVHWSDMLAVRPEWRDRGLGLRLKLYQRDQVMAAGVRIMHWTFDPLQARNAWLNFGRLAVVADEYAPDMYGQTDSPLHRGVGTDRLIVTWFLDSPRVRGRLDRVSCAPGPGEMTDLPEALGAAGAGTHPEPGVARFDLDPGPVLVSIPSDIAAMMAEDMGLAVAWRMATRRVLTHYMSEGWEVVEFVRGDAISRYVLTPPKHPTADTMSAP